MQPQIISTNHKEFTEEIYHSPEPEEHNDNEDSDLSPYESGFKHDQSSADKLTPLGIPKMGFSMALDLTKVDTKGQSDNKMEDLNKITKIEHEIIERSSIGMTSDQAHPIEPPQKAHDEPSYLGDSSSSSGYDFVPPPEYNPNIANAQDKPKPPPFALGGLGFKLNLTNVENANLITKEDKSRINELSNKPITFTKTANLPLESNMNDSKNEDDSENGQSQELIHQNFNNTAGVPKPMPKLPTFGGFGGGFKLDLAKVPTANIITDEDKEKLKDIPLISKNNFTDLNETKGEKPKKLNLKAKDSTTKITNEPSMPNLKITKAKNSKKK